MERVGRGFQPLIIPIGYFNVNTTTDLGKEWSWQVNANYVSARPTAQGEDSRFLSPNISLKKSFLDGKLPGLQWQKY
ncbi:MAG: outer membrane beta-barrel protein [Saprospiraceae bacterium]|nr:outer membrane beta-barrel protein [Saprospiraceae bacterium]